MDVVGPTLSPFALQSLESLTLHEDNDGRLLLRILRVNGNVGLIECHGLADGHVKGDLVDGILLRPLNSGVTPSVIEYLRVEGDLLGDIDLGALGNLNKIEVDGDIGTPSQFVSIASSAYLNHTRIGVVKCTNLYGGAYPSIDLQSLIIAGQYDDENIDGLWVRLLRDWLTEEEYDEDVPGIFINDGAYQDIEVAVSLLGDIEIAGFLQFGRAIRIPSLPSDNHILLGHHLYGTIRMEEEEGLHGQIVIDGGGDWEPPTTENPGQPWTGEVIVGYVFDPLIVIGPEESQPYRAPYYEALSSELGGGAIGLVPFMYHAKDSAPDHDSVITTGAFTGDVVIEHYGPVKEGNTGDSEPPVKVYRLALQVPPPGTVPDPRTTEVCDNRWTDVTSSYTYAVSGRNVTVSGTFANWRAYQIISNDLVCNIDGTPDVVYAQGWQGTIGCTGLDQTYGYGFQVKTGFDLNQNQMVESGDIETWLIEPADFDGDDDADVIDLSLLVDAVVNGGDE